jgi:hypothetical protein
VNVNLKLAIRGVGGDTTDYIPFMSYQTKIDYAAILMRPRGLAIGVISAWDGEAGHPIESLLSIEDRVFRLDEV